MNATDAIDRVDAEAAAAMIKHMTPPWTEVLYRSTAYPYKDAFEERRKIEVDMMHKYEELTNVCKETAKQHREALNRIMHNARFSPEKNTATAYTEREELDQCLISNIRELRLSVIVLRVENRSRLTVYAEIMANVLRRRSQTSDEQIVLRDYCQEKEYNVDLDELFKMNIRSD